MTDDHAHADRTPGDGHPGHDHPGANPGHANHDQAHADQAHADQAHADQAHADQAHDNPEHHDPEHHDHHHHGLSPHADRRWLAVALGLIAAFMAAEVVAGIVARSLALLSDAAHMLTDAGAIILALVAMRLAARPPEGGYTFGLRRAEILSAQANGLTMLILAVWLGIEAVRHLVEPPRVAGGLVLGTALVGIAVNLAAAWAMSRANRSSLNVEGAFQHIVSDLFAFIATAVAGVVLVTTGFARADAIATLVVVVLMVLAGQRLVRESGRIFLEAAPAGVDPPVLGKRLAALSEVVEVHDLHVWLITSGQPALSAHVLVDRRGDCHAVRAEIEDLLRREYRITHSTLQVDHDSGVEVPSDAHCEDSHGVSYKRGPHA